MLLRTRLREAKAAAAVVAVLVEVVVAALVVVVVIRNPDLKFIFMMLELCLKENASKTNARNEF